MNIQKKITKLTISSLMLLVLVILPFSYASAFSAGALIAGVGMSKKVDTKNVLIR